jgi:hypothetical protein
MRVKETVSIAPSLVVRRSPAKHAAFAAVL